MNTLLEGLTLAAACVVFAQLFGRFNLILGLIITGVFTFTKVIWGAAAGDAVRVGIAGSQPRILSSTIVIALCLVCVLLDGRRVKRFAAPAIPSLLILGVLAVFSWPSTNEVHAGLLHLGTALVAVLVGANVGSSLRDDVRHRDAMIRWLVLFLIFEAVVTALQYIGIEIFSHTSSAVDDATLAGRPGGTMSHPSTLGKYIFLAFVLLVPLRSVARGNARRWATSGIVIGFVPLVLSGGRANFAACLALFLVFSIIETSASRWNARFRTLALGVIVLVLSWGYWAERFRTGEDGTVRAHLDKVAISFLDNHGWLFGTGVNTYISAVGPTDPLTAAGWPAHNIVLMGTVELGALGCIALMLPALAPIVSAARQRRESGVVGNFSRATIASVPGILLIGMTGWGLLADPLIAWLFVAGVLGGVLRGRGEAFAATDQDESATPEVAAGSVSASSGPFPDS